MNTIREASIEDSPNKRNEFFNTNQDQSHNKCLEIISSKITNKSDTDLSSNQFTQDHTSLKSRSNLSLRFSNLLKSPSKSSLSPQSNIVFTDNYKSVTPLPTRKSNFKQRLRRFNSTIENHIFKQQNNENYINKNNKIQIKHEELIDEAKQVKLFKNDLNIIQNLSPDTDYYTKDYLSLYSSNDDTARRSMNSLYDSKYSTDNLSTTTKSNSTYNNYPSLNNVDMNKMSFNSSNNSISRHSNELDLYKKASYIEKPIVKDALKTSLKHLNNSNYLMSEPATSTRTIKTSKSNNENADITTTTTITTTKTIVKLNDLNRKKSLSKRRNTISSITFINNNTSLSQGSNEICSQNMPDKKINKIMANEIMEISETNIFDIIEREEIEYLKKKLIVSPEVINTINEYDLTPLDLALLLNNKEIITLLLKNGAIENPTLSDWNDRYDRVCTRLIDLDISLRHFLEAFDVTALTHEKIEEYDQMLKNLDFKMRLTRRSKNFYENLNYPGEVKNIVLDVQSATSLLVKFKEPDNCGDAFIIKYLIEWSSSSSFEPLDGQIVLSFVDTDVKQYLISNLVTFKVYYVRVSCANIRGYGAYSPSDPPFGIPSYWRDGDTVHDKLISQLRKLIDLDNEINLSKNNLDFVNPSLLNQLQKFSKSKKSSGLKRNLKTIFTLALATTSLNSSSYSNVNVNSLKFAKQIKKCSAYLVCVIHDGDKILTTLDENLPMIEIDENYSFQNINSDFQFLIKLSFNWNEIESFKNQIEQSITTSSLRFRYLTLCVIKQLQNLLEVNDLGRVHYNYIKNNSNGSVFFVLVKKMTNNFNQNFVKTIQIDKLIDKNTASTLKEINNSNQNSNNSTSNTFHKNNEDTTFLLKYLKLIMEYDGNCEKKLSKGFYVAFLKLQSSIELIKVMVPFKIPNNLPCEKVRNNPNVSREEWNLLKSVKFNQDKLSINELNSINFVKQVFEAINRLSKKFNLNDDETQSLRLITRELVEVNKDITLLLVCPTIEQTCIMQLADDNSQSIPLTLHDDFQYIHLPVQIFEAVHLSSYNLDFIKTYVKISVKLESELFASNQFNREAFSNEEINMSKKILALVSKYQKSLEDVWKESRWLINCINNARDKANQQAQSSIQLSDLKIFLEKSIEDKKLKNCSHCQRFDYNNNFNRKNIYNHITELPSKCNCQTGKNNLNMILSTIGFKTNSFNHIDSVLIDDEDIENHVQDTYGSIEDLTGKTCNFCDDCMKNCVNCQKNKSLNSLNSFDFYPTNKLFINESDSKTVNKLVSKLYISAPTTPSTPKNLSTEDLTGSKISIDYKLLNPKLSQNSFTSSACSVYSNSNPIIKEHLVESPLSTSSSSGYYSSKNDSNLPSPLMGNKTESWQCLNFNESKIYKKLNVYVDFDTGLKIDLNFECTLSGQMTCKDVIYQMIKKINSFINSFNQMSRGVSDKNEDDLVTLVPDFRASKFGFRGSKCDLDKLTNLDENPSLYNLVICLKNSYSNEKILSNNFVLANLKEPWLNGIFYLRNSSKVLMSKKNLQQF